MNAFQAYRQRLAAGQKAAPNIASPAISESYTHFLEGSIQPFLERFKSRAPSLVYYDKIAQCQNFAGAIYLPIAFAAKQLARSKVKIFQHNWDRRDLDGKKLIPLSDRPMYRMWTTDPNPNQTFSDILGVMSQQHDITGECYAWMPPEDAQGNYSEHGDPQELYTIPSAWVTGMPYGPFFTDGYYQITPYLTQYPGGSGSFGSCYIPADQMIRVYDPNPLLDRTAMSVLQAISQAVDTVRNIDQSRISGMAQGSQQSLALELDPDFWMQSTQIDMKVLKDRWQAANSGSRNAGRPMVLPPGVKPHNISFQPDDMAWQEGWEQLTDFVFACYHTNRAALGMSGDLNFATLYASIKQLYWSKLQPRTEQYAGRFNKDYFSPFVGEEYFCELVLPPMDDEQQKLARLGLLTKTGSITHAELRMECGMDVDPVEMPWLSERAFATGKPDEPAGGGDLLRDPAVERDRPTPTGTGLRGVDEPKLMDRLENGRLYGSLLNGKHH